MFNPFDAEDSTSMWSSIDDAVTENVWNPLSYLTTGHSTQLSARDNRPIDVNDPSTWTTRFEHYDPEHSGGGLFNPLNLLAHGMNELCGEAVGKNNPHR